MKNAEPLKYILQYLSIKSWKKSGLYVFSNLVAKTGSGFAQLLSVVIYARIHADGEASIIFVLLGYAIWLQVFEFGVSQAIQNKLNSKEWGIVSICRVVISHYFLVCLIGIIFAISFIPLYLFPVDKLDQSPGGVQAFSYGVGIMIVSTSNVVVQRFLLIIGRGLEANLLLLLQSVLAIVAMVVYFLVGIANIQVAVFIYLFPSMLVYFPTIMRIFRKSLKGNKESQKFFPVVRECAVYWGANALMSIFLGMDYYYVAHYLSSQDIVYYHFSMRFFFISYIIYFSYAQYNLRKLNKMTSVVDLESHKSQTRRTILIGLVSVSVVFGVFFSLGNFGVFRFFVEKDVFSPIIAILSFLYFISRVFRDSQMLFLWNSGRKKEIYTACAFEVMAGILLMSLTSIKYGSIGILGSLSVICLCSAYVLRFYIRTDVRGT